MPRSLVNPNGWFLRLALVPIDPIQRVSRVNSISFYLHVIFNVDCVLGTIRSLVSAECCSSLTSTTTSACPLSISRSTTLTKAWSMKSLRHISTSSEFLPYHNHIYSIYSCSNPKIINNVHLLCCQNYKNESFVFTNMAFLNLSSL